MLILMMFVLVVFIVLLATYTKKACDRVHYEIMYDTVEMLRKQHMAIKDISQKTGYSVSEICNVVRDLQEKARYE